MMARLLTRIGRAIAVSHAAADFAAPVYRGPITVIPNGLETGVFSAAHPASLRGPRSTSATSNAPPFRVLFVGRFDEPRKGLRHLLEAAAALRASGRDLQVHVVGTGREPAFARLAERAGAQFVGRLSDDRLAAAYRECDVFCAPSTHGESFGLVLIEAMACGRPVVASDIRGYREAADGAARLVPPGDASALAHAIAHVADDVTLRRGMIERGRRRARELDWGRVAAAVTAVYRSVVVDTLPGPLPGPGSTAHASSAHTGYNTAQRPPLRTPALEASA